MSDRIPRWNTGVFYSHKWEKNTPRIPRCNMGVFYSVSQWQNIPRILKWNMGVFHSHEWQNTHSIYPGGSISTAKLLKHFDAISKCTTFFMLVQPQNMAHLLYFQTSAIIPPPTSAPIMLE
jgi:hypothetical protein